ncbi:hypothetical protein Enr13x_15720 [Stieleria neptunia]|uniref:Uncharacterized protein n=1 Tax=Stieleria neptunia TaxID=2527979 RepID=A0A518HLR8_9BACT|nr:hypothetical protein [Stieleria neptunia]QDV41729.1 hypothetical protein Enr13x_15720 [Stieleria neptunia]
MRQAFTWIAAANVALILSSIAKGEPPTPVAEKGLRIGMEFDTAKSVLKSVGAKRVEEDQAVGYMPRQSRSEPLYGRHLYLIDEGVRLTVAVDLETKKVPEIDLRLIARDRFGRPTYFMASCSKVTFHSDGSYSVRFPGPRSLPVEHDDGE